MMRKTFFIYALLSLLLTFQHAFAANDQQSLDRIVAVINDDVITTSELNQALKIAKSQMEQQGIKIDNEKKFKKKILEQLIDKKVQLQIAKQAGIVISNHDLDEAVSNIAKQNGMTVSEFYQRLSAEGLSKEEYQSEMRDQITIQKLQQQQIIARIVITPEEVQEYAKSTGQGKTSVSTSFKIQDILIPFSDDPSKTEIANARQKADAVVSKLKHGKSVGELVKADPSIKVINMNWLDARDLPSAFITTVAKMQKNEISAPIQTGNGFHILHVVDRNSKTDDSPEIPVNDIQNKLGQKKFEEELQVWLAKLRSQAYIVNKLDEK